MQQLLYVSRIGPTDTVIRNLPSGEVGQFGVAFEPVVVQSQLRRRISRGSGGERGGNVVRAQEVEPGRLLPQPVRAVAERIEGFVYDIPTVDGAWREKYRDEIPFAMHQTSRILEGALRKEGAVTLALALGVALTLRDRRSLADAGWLLFLAGTSVLAALPLTLAIAAAAFS